jgi:next-to-BRCA1 protein 1
MEPQVTLNVTFKNETQSFLVSDPENTTWADVEAMVSTALFCFSVGYTQIFFKM